MSEPVYLPPQLFVGEGKERKCYRHPTEFDRCIKLPHPAIRSSRFRSEIRFYRSLQSRGVDFSHLTRYHGLIDTSLGRGTIYDLVLDDDGRISKSLPHYLAQQDPAMTHRIVLELERLKQNFYDQWIVFHDLNPTNILLRRLSYDDYRLVVIDGMGHNHFIPLANYSPSFARKKLVRAWNRRHREWYASYPVLQRALKPYLSA